MIRFRVHVKKNHLAGLMLALLVLAIAMPCFASDNDGIVGYSIRLKNKDFNSEGSGSAPGGVVVGPQESSVRFETAQQEIQQATRLQLAIRVFAEWAAVWLR